MARRNTPFVVVTILAVLKLILWIALYGAIASGLGGLNTDKGQFYLELPIIILISLPLYFGLRGKVKLPSLLSLLPVLTFYSFMDYFYWSMGRVFQWIDLGEIFELIDVLPFYYIGILVLVLCLLVFIFYNLYKRISYINIFASLLPLAITIVWSVAFPTSFVATFEQNAFRVQIWSLDKNVSDNGRWLTPLYSEALRKQALLQIDQEEGWLEDDLLLIQSTLDEIDQRNIYIMVMESFLDPTVFPTLEVPDDYLSPWMKELQAFKNFSQSPVYGGSTAQAEFEILCGVPAKALVGSIEFNSFSGSPTSCLPNWLNTVGARTVAQNAFKPSYFNQVKSYEGLGFKQMFFPKEYANASDTHLHANLTKSSGHYMFDGDFFDQAISYFIETNEPQVMGLNYMLGIYGHFNFKLDVERFPEVIDLKNTEFEDLHNIANQYYYRSRAIEQSVKKIIDNDPESIILVVSDHLPPLPGSKSYYLSRGYPEIHTNVFYLWDKGEPVKVEGPTHHYDLVWKLLSLLMKDECADDCFSETDADRYNQIMAHAMRLNGPDVEYLLNIQ